MEESNDPFVGLAALLNSCGIDADYLRHHLGVEHDISECLMHLKPGDQVAVNRTIKVPVTNDTFREVTLAHWHHGIYIGGSDVVDFGADNEAGPATIAVRTFRDFCGDHNTVSCRLIKVNWPPHIGRSLEASLAAATTIAAMEAEDRRARYNLHNCNCQHLATWCRLGRWVNPRALAAVLHAVPPRVRKRSACLL